jgi:hypothetical protein
MATGLADGNGVDGRRMSGYGTSQKSEAACFSAASEG